MTTQTTTTADVGIGNTTVQVSMADYHFVLSTSTVPSGKVTFVIKNDGVDVHNFDLNNVKSGAILSPVSLHLRCSIPRRPWYVGRLAGHALISPEMRSACSCAGR